MEEDFIGKELLGQFRIVERIGRGGMGEVYKAEQPAMERMVAIKILHAKLASRQDLVSRFRREARAMSRLSHPNTARIFLYGHLEETEQFYIVMEYLEGVDLARLVRQEGPLGVERASRILMQVLGALEEAHASGIVHRDLKPENILLTNQGGIADFPKVLDFGLAKIRETRLRPGSMVLTQEGMVFGTPEFMSPEQARGETLDARSDIYSVGMIYYELLTGQLPFPKCKPMEYISHHIYTPPVPVAERAPELNLPPALNPIVARALEKDRANRYHTALEFAEALKEVLPSSMLRDRTSPMRILTAEMSPPVGRVQVPARETTNLGASKRLFVAMIAIIVVLIAVLLWMVVIKPAPAPIYLPSLQPAPAGSP